MLLNKQIGIGVAGLVLTACQPNAAQSELVIKSAFEPPSTCTYSVEGQNYALPADEARFEQDLKRWAKSRRVAIASDANTPYKCIGSAHFHAQRAGFKRARTAHR